MKINIELLQPHEYVLNERKLARVRWMYSNGLFVTEPSVIPFEDRFIIVDGNHTTYVNSEQGKQELEVKLEAHRRTEPVNHIIQKGIRKIQDLSAHILTHNEWRKIYSEPINFDDDLSDEEFFRKYPEIEPFCSYRKK